MFENIIGQTNVINSLKNEILANRYPPAILLHGPEYSGKLSTALEIARVLNCSARYEWSCACTSCEQFRLLIHPNLMLMGFRDFTVEISAASDVLLRTREISARYLFMRSIRKLLKGFDPTLWLGDEAKIKTLQTTVQEIEEELFKFQPDYELPADKVLKSSVANLNTLCEKLAANAKSDNIPINQVRNAIFWAHHSSMDGRKIIILDNADKMLESSRNALLKTLEEPPASLVLILITANKGAIIRTILSRVRPYHFRERTKEESRTILWKIFKEDNEDFIYLKDYFMAWKQFNPALLRSLADRFIQNPEKSQHK